MNKIEYDRYVSLSIDERIKRAVTQNDRDKLLADRGIHVLGSIYLTYCRASRNR